MIVTGTIGRTTSSKDDTDRDVAVAASHAVTLGEMTLEASEAVDEDVEASADAADAELKGARGTLFPCFSSLFFTSLSSFFFQVRPWRIVA